MAERFNASTLKAEEPTKFQEFESLLYLHIDRKEMVDLAHDYQRLYCPNEIKVFCRLRDENSKDIVAYPSYLKDKKIRNLASCKVWTDDIITTIDTPKTFTNEYISGYKIIGLTTLNWYADDRIELLDPRGFIICVTMNNFLEIICKTNIINGYIQTPCKFAFTTYSSTTTPLKLITIDTPIEEIEYVNKLQNNKVRIADLKVGYTYVDKGNYEFLYLGRIKAYELTTTKTEHIFVHFIERGQHNFYSHKDTRTFAFEKGINTEANIEELLTKYTKSRHLSPLSNFGFFEIALDESQHNSKHLYRKEGNKIYYTTNYMTSTSIEHALTLAKGDPTLNSYKKPIREPFPIYSIELNKEGFDIKEEGNIMSDIKNIDKYTLGYLPFVLYEDGTADMVRLSSTHITHDYHNSDVLFPVLFQKRKSTMLI